MLWWWYIHANVAQSKHNVFPVPVGDCNNPFWPVFRAWRTTDWRISHNEEVERNQIAYMQFGVHMVDKGTKLRFLQCRLFHEGHFLVKEFWEERKVWIKLSIETRPESSNSCCVLVKKPRALSMLKNSESNDSSKSDSKSDEPLSKGRLKIIFKDEV